MNGTRRRWVGWFILIAGLVGATGCERAARAGLRDGVEVGFSSVVTTLFDLAIDRFLDGDA